MTGKILIVEDEPTLQETLVYNLARQGYVVEAVGDGLAALEAARRTKMDLIVLDLMLPKLDGFEVCRILRQKMSVPILMLTARDEEIDRVIGLEMGADDYLTKPFSMREMIARVKALIRRVRLDQAEAVAQTVRPPDPLVFDDLEIDINRREVRLGAQIIRLKPKEYELLLFLARHPGQVLTRELILERVWGWDFTGGSRTVDVHMRWLREKIEPNPSQPVRLVTVRGVGYRFEG